MMKHVSHVLPKILRGFVFCQLDIRMYNRFVGTFELLDFDDFDFLGLRLVK